VRIKSKRGTETRDEDEVIVQALFKNMETAESESQRLNQIVKERLLDARKVTNPQRNWKWISNLLSKMWKSLQ